MRCARPATFTRPMPMNPFRAPLTRGVQAPCRCARLARRSGRFGAHNVSWRCLTPAAADCDGAVRASSRESALGRVSFAYVWRRPGWSPCWSRQWHCRDARYAYAATARARRPHSVRGARDLSYVHFSRARHSKSEPRPRARRARAAAAATSACTVAPGPRTRHVIGRDPSSPTPRHRSWQSRENSRQAAVRRRRR